MSQSETEQDAVQLPLLEAVVCTPRVRGQRSPGAWSEESKETRRRERAEARERAAREIDLHRVPERGEVNPYLERRFTITLGTAKASATGIAHAWAINGHASRSWHVQMDDGRRRNQHASFEWAAEEVWRRAHDVDRWVELHPDDEAALDAFVQAEFDRYETFLSECRALCDEPDTAVLPPLVAGEAAGFVYLVAPARSSRGTVKIGFTVKDPHRRLSNLQTGSPVRLKLLSYIRGTREDEKALHKRFDHLRGAGEWFQSSHTITEAFTRLRSDPTRRP